MRFLDVHTNFVPHCIFGSVGNRAGVSGSSLREFGNLGSGGVAVDCAGEGSGIYGIGGGVRTDVSRGVAGPIGSVSGGIGRHVGGRTVVKSFHVGRIFGGYPRRGARAKDAAY